MQANHNSTAPAVASDIEPDGHDLLPAMKEEAKIHLGDKSVALLRDCLQLFSSSSVTRSPAKPRLLNPVNKFAHPERLAFRHAREKTGCYLFEHGQVLLPIGPCKMQIELRRSFLCDIDDAAPDDLVRRSFRCKGERCLFQGPEAGRKVATVNGGNEARSSAPERFVRAPVKDMTFILRKVTHGPQRVYGLRRKFRNREISEVYSGNPRIQQEAQVSGRKTRYGSAVFTHIIRNQPICFRRGPLLEVSPGAQAASRRNSTSFASSLPSTGSRRPVQPRRQESCREPHR